MVYNSAERSISRCKSLIKRALQTDCLYCKCPLTTPEEPIPHINGLCNYCLSALPHIQGTCRRCAIPTPHPVDLCGRCQKAPPAFDQSISALIYKEAARTWIWRLKNKGDKSIISASADLLSSRLHECEEKIDLIVPVPMHWKQNLKRGHNHAALLAIAVSQKVKVPCSHSLVEQQHPKKAQKSLTIKDRRRQLKGIYRCRAGIDGKHIAVVDDVMTTGSTMEEITRVLKAEGAARVSAWALARTP